MKLKALDQVHVSAVKNDSLRPGEVFEVSDEVGKELLKRKPALVVEIASESAAKAEPALANKKALPPANKAAPKRSAKTKAN